MPSDGTKISANGKNQDESGDASEPLSEARSADTGPMETTVRASAACAAEESPGGEELIDAQRQQDIAERKEPSEERPGCDAAPQGPVGRRQSNERHGARARQAAARYRSRASARLRRPTAEDTSTA